MRALTSLDSMFIAAEDGRTVANVSSLAILDSADVNENRLTRSDIQELVAQRLHLLPPLRWRLVDVPLGLGHPSWVDCGNDIDLDYHVRETALPAPGGPRRMMFIAVPFPVPCRAAATFRSDLRIDARAYATGSG